MKPTPGNPSRIRHNPSRRCDGLADDSPNSRRRTGESVESVTNPSRARVTDLEGCNASNNKYIYTLSSNTSRCHAHPRARRARTREGGVTDLRDGLGTSRNPPQMTPMGTVVVIGRVCFTCPVFLHNPKHPWRWNYDDRNIRRRTSPHRCRQAL